MPTEEGIRLEDEQGFLPMLDATREENEPEAIRLRTSRLFDLTMKENELMAEKRILGDQVRLGASQVGNGSENHRMMERLSEMEEGLFRDGEETDKQLGQPMDKGSHVNGLQKTVKSYQQI